MSDLYVTYPPIHIPNDRLTSILRPGDVVFARGPFRCSSERYIVTEVLPWGVRGVPDPRFLEESRCVPRDLKKKHIHSQRVIKKTNIYGFSLEADKKQWLIEVGEEDRKEILALPDEKYSILKKELNEQRVSYTAFQEWRHYWNHKPYRDYRINIDLKWLKG